MALEVVNGATLVCTGAVPPGTSSLVVLPIHRTNVGGQPAANIGDFVPLTNIQPFGMCLLPSNPVVAAATAAASGVLTPAPCIPNTTTPWTPGSPTVTIDKMLALNNTSTCQCLWGGTISVTQPGQMTVTEP